MAIRFYADRMFRRRGRPPVSSDLVPGGTSARVIIPIPNRFAGLTQISEPCRCSVYFGGPHPSPPFQIHTESQDTTCEAWQRLVGLIDEAADESREEFIPGAEMPEEMRRQIVTLPPSIAKLVTVKKFSLYGSNLIAIPPEIGEMKALQEFHPYTSRRLHWFPYEITRCPALRDSTVSTRNIYGNFKYRMPFPKLPAAVPIGSTPACCSVCRGPLPASEAIQVWISLPVATDVLPLLVHACSDECVRSLPTPPQGYVNRPHHGGTDLAQPDTDAFFAGL
jgi:hypothetical protein